MLNIGDPGTGEFSDIRPTENDGDGYQFMSLPVEAEKSNDYVEQKGLKEPPYRPPIRVPWRSVRIEG